jgi:hypothetical protein
MSMALGEALAAPLTCTTALTLMRRALGVLDENDCAPDIGAHLDLACARLEQWLLDPGRGANTGWQFDGFADSGEAATGTLG